MNLKTIIFTGRSGCGKGTQIDKLIEYLKSVDYRNILHAESGNRFRKFIAGESFANKLSNQISKKGELQPEFLATWVWSSDLIENLKDDMHLMMDGTPRRLEEAKVLESAFNFFERPHVDVVYINVSREWSIQRMQNRGRQDDKDMQEIISRLNWFDSDVVPVIDYYRGHKSHTFHEINGEQEIEKVFEDILKSLDL